MKKLKPADTIKDRLNEIAGQYHDKWAAEKGADSTEANWPIEQLVEHLTSVLGDTSKNDWSSDPNFADLYEDVAEEAAADAKDVNNDGDADVATVDTDGNGKPDAAVVDADSSAEATKGIEEAADKLEDGDEQITDEDIDAAINELSDEDREALMQLLGSEKPDEEKPSEEKTPDTSDGKQETEKPADDDNVVSDKKEKDVKEDEPKCPDCGKPSSQCVCSDETMKNIARALSERPW